MLITILIIGIIAAVVTPVVKKSMPDKFEAMRRKTYYILENTVSQMFSDDIMYPEKPDKSIKGFGNTDSIRIDGRVYGGDKKFCELFAGKFTKRVNTVTDCTAGTKTFTSADNVDWYLPVTDFSGGYAEVKFDVNGSAEPNCEYDAVTCEHPDIFKYYILSTGKISEDVPHIGAATYCINTTIESGSGSVTPSTEYCGLTNGNTYTLTAVPDEGWVSSWPDNRKNVKINNKDYSLSVSFTEIARACLKLNVYCESGSPENCGTYSVNGNNFDSEDGILKVCNLYPDNYSVTVTPKSGYIASWTSKDIYLSGQDAVLSVALREKKNCAILDVTCPAGNAGLCGEYKLIGGGVSYNLSFNGNQAQNCGLKNGSYTLSVTPKWGYTADKTSFNVSISDNDWENSLTFTSTIKNCHNDGYFEAGGKKFSCIFQPEPITRQKCVDTRDALGINDCSNYYYDRCTASWKCDKDWNCKRDEINGIEGPFPAYYGLEGQDNCRNFYKELVENLTDTLAQNDYWAGAAQTCGGVDKLPTAEDLWNIAKLFYQNSSAINISGYTENLLYKTGTAAIYGLYELPFSLWAREEFSATLANHRTFDNGYTDGRYSYRSSANIQAVCILE